MIEPITEQTNHVCGENLTIGQLVNTHYTRHISEINKELSVYGAEQIDSRFVNLFSGFLRAEGDPSGVFLSELDHISTTAKQAVFLGGKFPETFGVVDPDQLTAAAYGGFLHDISFQRTAVPIQDIKPEQLFDYEHLVLERMVDKTKHPRESVRILDSAAFQELFTGRMRDQTRYLIQNHGKSGPNEFYADLLRIADFQAHIYFTMIGNVMQSRMMINTPVRTQYIAKFLNQSKGSNRTLPQTQDWLRDEFNSQKNLPGGSVLLEEHYIPKIQAQKSINVREDRFKDFLEHLKSEGPAPIDHTPLREIGIVRSRKITRQIPAYFGLEGEIDFVALQDERGYVQ